MSKLTLPAATGSAAEAPPAPPAARPLPLGVRLVRLALVLGPLLGLVAAVVLFWGWGFGWVELGLFLGMYLVTSLGVTVGFHRLFTHGSFETHAAVKFILAALGSMAAQGSVLDWVAVHRRHHQHSDKDEDPHSPHHHGRGLFGVMRGLWHAHIGWMLRQGPTGLSRYVKDLRRSVSLRVASALFPLWVVLGLLIPAVLGGLLTWSWWGALLGLLWGGLARMFLFHHVSWGVNSICHLWGGRPHESGDHSTNNVLLGLLALGEGWHNNHHAFPTSARHGLRWWQIDVSYYSIKALALIGLAWNVRLPALQEAAT
ncbi:MAG TPA: acyl-CoA desaturase [Gemmataceae bacterium]|nr:acyl-CoA desaturase [Gemmataceae bacterium]